MKVVVFTCSTGGGHNSAARYIKDEFNLNGVVCDVVDYMNIVGPNASKNAEKIYLSSTKGSGKVFGGVYHLGEAYNKTKLKSPVYGLNKLVGDKLYEFIKTNNYDVIITTHLFPSLALTAVKRKHNIKFINIATDYECIPFWNETNPDIFVIPSKELTERFISKGISKDVLLPTGIPISTKFLNTSKLNINTNKDIILLTSGSMGFGDIEGVVRDILQNIDCYLVVVCGNNESVYKTLKSIDNTNLEVLGFINNMNDYISASSIVITKAGGITITEVATLHKPMIITSPIPGVEEYNARFFDSNGLALVAHNNSELISLIHKLLSNKKLQNEMILKQNEVISGHSAKNLIEYIIKENNNE